MLMRSTGLGKTELEGGFKTITSEADYLIFQMDTTSPVKWKVRVAMTLPELVSALFLVLKSGRAWLYILSHLFKKRNHFKRPENF